MKEKNNTLVTPEGHKLTFYERESVEINLNIPKDTLETLEIIAQKRDLSIGSLLKLFIGKGIRDLEPELANKTATERFRNRKKFKEEKEEVDLVA